MEANRSDTRVVRAARNEALFREVNERLENLAHTFEQVAGPGTSFACECADLDCLKQVAMSVDEYERVRSHPNQFVVLPGHVDPEVENVLAENERYVVVAKIGAAAEIATASDPRRPDRTQPQQP